MSDIGYLAALSGGALFLLTVGLGVLVSRRRRTRSVTVSAVSDASVLAGWPARRWVAAVLGAGATTVVIAVPTDLIDTPIFGRDMPVTWWAWPALLVTAVLSGLLLATYVTPVAGTGDQAVGGTGSRTGVTGATLSLFAVGCPVCNKIVLVALGYSGAITWFAPAQPILAVASVVLLAWALGRRLRGERACPVIPVDRRSPESGAAESGTPGAGGTTAAPRRHPAGR